MAETKQKKKTDMIRVTIIGYVKAPEFTLEEFKRCEDKLNTIEAFASEHLTDMEFKKRKVGRLVDVKPEENQDQNDANKSEGGTGEEE